MFFLLKDFIEWNIHRLLHNVPWLWEFHKLHHSIERLDGIGNFRFYWAEIVVYKTLSYLPLVILGINSTVILIIGIMDPGAGSQPRQCQIRLRPPAVRSEFTEDARMASRR